MAQAKLKILMIHGYTESGESFRSDIRNLEQALHKAFPPAPSPDHHPLYPGGLELVYPTGTWRLKPTDWQRYFPGTDPGFAWFYKVLDDDEFPGLLDGLTHLGNIMKSQGPFAGVIGYSQGGFLASILASLLEPSRREVFDQIEKESGGIPFPIAFDGVAPLKFAVSYCGFAALNMKYKAFYVPRISTPLLQVNGRIDDVVDHKRSQRLIDATTRTEEEKVLIHSGGHIVPTARLYTDAVIMFIRRNLAPEN